MTEEMQLLFTSSMKNGASSAISSGTAEDLLLLDYIISYNYQSPFCTEEVSPFESS